MDSDASAVYVGPREYEADYSDHILLFRTDSKYSREKNIDIMWGDSGVGNFFIHPDNLRKLDYSRVMYI